MYQYTGVRVPGTTGTRTQGYGHCTTRGRTYEILSTETYLLYQYVYYQYFWRLPESSKHFQIFHWILLALRAATPAADIG